MLMNGIVDMAFAFVVADVGNHGMFGGYATVMSRYLLTLCLLKILSPNCTLSLIMLTYYSAVPSIEVHEGVTMSIVTFLFVNTLSSV